jgi:hypothetical protein
MNKELLNENLNLILEGLKTVIHTANAELPAILEEIVRWGLVSNLIFLFLFIGLALLAIVLIRYIIKSDWEDKGLTIAFLLTIFFVPWLFFLVKTIYYLALVLTSPKLYIIDYIKDLI